MDFKTLTTTLDGLNLSPFLHEFIDQVEIDYGTRRGKHKIKGIENAVGVYDQLFVKGNKYNNIFNSLRRSSSDKGHVDFLFCLKALDWGEMQTSNLFKVITLYENNALSRTLDAAQKYFSDDDFLTSDQIDSLPWSSGWTKVYSFMASEGDAYRVCIYDSRVSFFINYLFLRYLDSHPDKAEDVRSLTKYLEMLPSNTSDLVTRKLSSAERVRLGIPSIGQKRKQGIIARGDNAESRLIANKMASWIIRYLCKKEYVQTGVSKDSFRNYDIAFFMLGFSRSSFERLN